MNIPSPKTDSIPLELWLIRHGETSWSQTGRHTGLRNIPLTERGRQQASALTPTLAAQHFDTVLSSPLSRAVETCHLAGLGQQAELEPDLHEWNYGIYEGHTTKEIQDRNSDWSIWDSPIPEGENLAQVQARATSLIQRLLALHGRVALFSHAHFLRVLAGIWIGNSALLGAHLILDTGAFSILGFERETRAIRQWNVQPRSAESTTSTM